MDEDSKGKCLTFQSKPCKVVLQVVDGRKEDFHVQNEFLGHPDGLEVLSIADLPEHIRNACSTGLLIGGQYTAPSQAHARSSTEGADLRPYPIDLLFHPDLLLT